MRTLERNKSTFWYALQNDTQEVEYDEYGNELSERGVAYERPVCMSASISEATGIVAREPFGPYQDYDKVIITEWMGCPISETTVLCIDKEPTYNDDEELLYDYVVRRVSRTKNYIAYLVAKVDVT